MFANIIDDIKKYTFSFAKWSIEVLLLRNINDYQDENLNENTKHNTGWSGA